MTGRDFLAVARQCAAMTSEPWWRTAVGRAYYAAFHEARELLTDLGFTVPPDERAHKYLIYRLSNCGTPAIEQAGRSLDALRDLRNLADYDLRRSLVQSMALMRARLAEQVIVAFDSASQQPTHTQITDAMKLYERDVLQDVTWKP